MKIATIILSVLLVMVLALCVFVTYLWIDRSVTLTYVNASLDSEVRSRGIITGIVENEWRGKSQSEIYRKLNMEVKKYPEKSIILKKTEKGIDFDSIHFQFENGKLKKID